MMLLFNLLTFHPPVFPTPHLSTFGLSQMLTTPHQYIVWLWVRNYQSSGLLKKASESGIHQFLQDPVPAHVLLPGHAKPGIL